jgi:hypothetical protein
VRFVTFVAVFLWDHSCTCRAWNGHTPPAMRASFDIEARTKQKLGVGHEWNSDTYDPELGSGVTYYDQLRYMSSGLSQWGTVTTDRKGRLLSGRGRFYDLQILCSNCSILRSLVWLRVMHTYSEENRRWWRGQLIKHWPALGHPRSPPWSMHCGCERARTESSCFQAWSC